MLFRFCVKRDAGKSIELVNAKWLITCLLPVLQCVSESDCVGVSGNRASAGNTVTDVQLIVLKNSI